MKFFLQVFDSCATGTDCSKGLYCGNCPAVGKKQPTCIRGQANIPTSIVSSCVIVNVWCVVALLFLIVLIVCLIDRLVVCLSTSIHG